MRSSRSCSVIHHCVYKVTDVFWLAARRPRRCPSSLSHHRSEKMLKFYCQNARCDGWRVRKGARSQKINIIRREMPFNHRRANFFYSIYIFLLLIPYTYTYLANFLRLTIFLVVVGTDIWRKFSSYVSIFISISHRDVSLTLLTSSLAFALVDSYLFSFI